MKKSRDIFVHLAARLKETRRSKGLSLEAVAKLSGVSRSMVSQIERGDSSPTVATLWNLTEALQVDFAELLDGKGASDVIEVIRADRAPTIVQHGEGCYIRILSRSKDAGDCEIYDVQFDPNGVLDSQPHGQGAREALTVIQGRLKVTAGENSEILNEGDTAHYAVNCEHRIEAIEYPARAFLLIRNG